MKRVTALLSLVLMSAVSLPALAQGQWAHQYSPGEARTALDKGDVVPLRDILERLKARYGGHHNDANLVREAGQVIYVIDWQTGAGEQLRLKVDARTGRIQS